MPLHMRFGLGFFAVVLLAGCGASSVPQPSGAPAPLPRSAAKWENGRLAVDVPVPVVTISFPQDAVEALRAALQPFTVNHASGDLNQTFPPDVDEVLETGDPVVLLPAFGETITLPVLPTAHYQVTAASPALTQAFARALDAARIDEQTFDANTIEDFLANALPAHGIALNPNAPGIVLLHLEALGVGTHGWKIQGQTGFLAPVRLFGERHPVLVIDPSAVPDSYTGGSAYDSPLAADATAEIVQFVRDATEYRVLQGSIYPIAQAPCHAVTGILGIRHNTSLGEAILRQVEDAFDAARVKAGWDHLTGSDVFFDVKILSLPEDDPVLDALARGEFPAFEVLRAYLSLMFEQYHVEHPGCEAYLSVVFAGDVATVPGGGVIGIGTYDDSPGQRISMSWVHEVFRFTFDPESPLCIASCDGKDYLNWWEYLFSHETGHILGQRHPHDITRADPGPEESLLGASNNSFSSIWSSMSYEQDGRMIDFGAIDQANWRRNRAGFALALAAQNGRENTPEWALAMDAASRLDWQGVWAALSR
ncbi:hypothetical protein SAMN04488120_10722 [Fontimonas thermophila]|uniref:Metallo-peptidase family M12B Reprolysin-like n=1 Tax=Fontimonas thermophila TaxID=1076937 RepID=A0A1I2JEJ0_9GAMM|nr:hypothetical protein [Fontimonas thermophila]SFF52709.1 hypothetical protein SAMN04488120_10722 [Fontimonas thermophila]